MKHGSLKNQSKRSSFFSSDKKMKDVIADDDVQSSDDTTIPIPLNISHNHYLN